MQYILALCKWLGCPGRVRVLVTQIGVLRSLVIHELLLSPKHLAREWSNVIAQLKSPHGVPRGVLKLCLVSRLELAGMRYHIYVRFSSVAFLQITSYKDCWNCTKSRITR